MLYLKLFWEFFYIGLFSFGGGYATLPFLYDIAEKYHWYTYKQLSDMIGIASVTPGPVGINVATFAGFQTLGILGALLATFAIILPSYIIVTIVYKLTNKFKANPIVKGAILALRPAGCALLTSVGLKLLTTSKLNLLGSLLLVILITTSIANKRSPGFYLGISALYGLILGFFNVIGV